MPLPHESSHNQDSTGTSASRLFGMVPGQLQLNSSGLHHASGLELLVLPPCWSPAVLRVVETPVWAPGEQLLSPHWILLVLLQVWSSSRRSGPSRSGSGLCSPSDPEGKTLCGFFLLLFGEPPRGGHCTGAAIWGAPLQTVPPLTFRPLFPAGETAVCFSRGSIFRGRKLAPPARYQERVA